jgi:hypothetical protein
MQRHIGLHILELTFALAARQAGFEVNMRERTNFRPVDRRAPAGDAPDREAVRRVHGQDRALREPKVRSLQRLGRAGRVAHPALEPLHAAGKLGAVHFQFAPWITSGGEPRRLVEYCVQVMSDTLMAVEFRTASWWNERNRASTLAFEREHRLVNVMVAGPKASATACRHLRGDVAAAGNRAYAWPQPRDPGIAGA